MDSFQNPAPLAPDPMPPAFDALAEVVPVPHPDLPYVEDPPWSVGELLVIVSVLLGSLLFFMVFGIAFLMAKRHIPMREIASSPSAGLVIVSMSAAYAVTLITAYAMIGAGKRPFWKSLRWNWPAPKRALAAVSSGLGLAVAVSILGKFLPMPKSLPIEKFFKDASSAWLLLFFGLLVAPFVEEFLFRGLLYPVLNRGFRQLFAETRRLRHTGMFLAGLLLWGYVENRASRLLGGLLILALVIGAAVWIFMRRDFARSRAVTTVVAVFVLFTWGVFARVANHRTLLSASLGAAVLSLLLLLLARARLSEDLALRLAVAVSVLLTSLAFAFTHAEQLANSLAPLLLILVVGLVLTTVRAVTKSLATGLLIHFGYNGTLFAVMFIATSGFRHMERLQ